MKTVDRLQYLKKNLTPKKIIDATFPVFIKNTPVKSGNARRRTISYDNSIIANYSYATRLDEGWSKQSPQGMVKPTIQAARDYIKKVIGK